MLAISSLMTVANDSTDGTDVGEDGVLNPAQGECVQKQSAAELAEIERVASISNSAFLAAARLLAAAVRDGETLWLAGIPLTVGGLRGVIAETLTAAGLTQPEGNLIAVGAPAAEPHHIGEDIQRIAVGECVLIDLFPKSLSREHPVFSDCSRTFCVGCESAQARELVRAAADVVTVKALVVEELQTALRERGSVRGFALQQSACAEFRRMGWHAQVDEHGEVLSIGAGYVHGLGHGVGGELHQHPTFSAQFAQLPGGTVSAGQAITIEPALYQPGQFGVRYEDLYVVELDHTGSVQLRLLTNLPWALDPKEFLALWSRSMGL